MSFNRCEPECLLATIVAEQQELACDFPIIRARSLARRTGRERALMAFESRSARASGRATFGRATFGRATFCAPQGKAWLGLLEIYADAKASCRVSEAHL